MVGKMDGLEPEQRTDEATSSVFREVLGQRPGFTRGLGEMVIPESTRQPDREREREYLALIEKHKKDADNYKTQLDEMRDALWLLGKDLTGVGLKELQHLEQQLSEGLLSVQLNEGAIIDGAAGPQSRMQFNYVCGQFHSSIKVVQWLVKVPYVGLNFAVYESLKDWFVKTRTFGLVEDSELSVTTWLACGAAAGTVGQTVAYPLDVIRRRMQMVGWSNAASIVTGDGSSKAPLEYTSIFANIQKLRSI